MSSTISPSIYFPPVGPLDSRDVRSAMVDGARSSALTHIESFMATPEALRAAGFVTDKPPLSLRERLLQQQEAQRLRSGSNASDVSSTVASSAAAPAIGGGKPIGSTSAAVGSTALPQGLGTVTPASSASTKGASNADNDLGDFDNPTAASVHGKTAVFAASFSNSLDESVQGRFQQQVPASPSSSAAFTATSGSKVQPLKPPTSASTGFDGGMDLSQRGMDSSTRRGLVPPPRSTPSLSASAFHPSSATSTASVNLGLGVPQSTQQQQQSAFSAFGDDPFAAFNASSSSFPTSSSSAPSDAKLRSEVTLLYQEDIQCISRNGACEKLDYHGTIHVELDNKNYPEGSVALEVKDTLAHVLNILPNQSVVKAPITVGTDSRVKLATCRLQGNKTSVGALRCSYVPSLRPLLFQARTTTTWTGAIATIVVRISINPNFKQPIDNFTILASVAHLAKAFPDAASAVVKNVISKPSGGTHSASNSVVVWQCARLDPTKQAQLQFEAALEFPTAPGDALVALNTAASAGPAVIIKGGYNSQTLTAVETNATSVTFAEGVVCKDFDLKVNRSKRLKFEYRFI